MCNRRLAIFAVMIPVALILTGCSTDSTVATGPDTSSENVTTQAAVKNWAIQVTFPDITPGSDKAISLEARLVELQQQVQNQRLSSTEAKELVQGENFSVTFEVTIVVIGVTTWGQIKALFLGGKGGNQG